MAYEVIPQAPNYEMNENGFVRNRQTKRILKWQRGRCQTKQITFRVKGKRICLSQPSLMWYLHGRITSKKRPIPVVISKGTRSMRFDSLKQCSTWLAECHGLSESTCWIKLVRRVKVIDGWDIHYCY